MILAFALFSYLFGSIPSGYLLIRARQHKDIRDFGSRSTGATNVLRTSGWKMAVPVAAFDVLKGFLPVFFGMKLFPGKPVVLVFGFCAIVGHCFPVFIKFRGGKGVATSVGVYAAAAFFPLLCTLGVFLFVIGTTRFVSLGSLTGAFCFPFFVYLIDGQIETIILGAAVFLLVLVRHWGNIQRLAQGKERKLGEKTA
jgi:glycerol-3-phosphate acyltransferase PlsY